MAVPSDGDWVMGDSIFCIEKLHKCNLAGLGALSILWVMAQQVVNFQPCKMVLMYSNIPFHRTQGHLHTHECWHTALNLVLYLFWELCVKQQLT